MAAKRFLIVTADDFGIGPETSRGIVDLAEQGGLTCTVLLVNSPHAEHGVQMWRERGRPIELGWHPCLTMDAPVLAAARVPSLVDVAGKFLPLGLFLRRLYLGAIQPAEIRSELQAQYARFCTLVGAPPSLVNGHHHVHIFEPVGSILMAILKAGPILPFMRYLREPFRTLATVPGARAKRCFLTTVGARSARKLAAAGFPGNQWLAGITNPEYVADPQFMARWIGRAPGDVVELMTHPGYHDTTIRGRDGDTGAAAELRRARELGLLLDPAFRRACDQAGFTLVPPSRCPVPEARRARRAA